MHARGKPIAPDVDLDVIARRTPGFTGADLANVINEGALLTARHNGKQITMDALEEAIDRVMAGPERKSVLLSEKERKVIAYHEGGHALVGHAMPQRRPGAQGDDHPARPGARLHQLRCRPRTSSWSPAPRCWTSWPCCSAAAPPRS